MGALVLPDGSTMDVFGTGGGAMVAERLSAILGHTVPLLGSIPLDPTLREQGDAGVPVTIAAPESAAARAIDGIVKQLVVRADSLAGKPLGLGVTRR